MAVLGTQFPSVPDDAVGRLKQKGFSKAWIGTLTGRGEERGQARRSPRSVSRRQGLTDLPPRVFSDSGSIRADSVPLPVGVGPSTRQRREQTPTPLAACASSRPAAPEGILPPFPNGHRFPPSIGSQRVNPVFRTMRDRRRPTAGNRPSGCSTFLHCKDTRPCPERCAGHSLSGWPVRSVRFVSSLQTVALFTLPPPWRTRTCRADCPGRPVAVGGAG